jgi:hypothetical protein
MEELTIGEVVEIRTLFNGFTTETTASAADF